MSLAGPQYMPKPEEVVSNASKGENLPARERARRQREQASPRPFVKAATRRLDMG